MNSSALQPEQEFVFRQEHWNANLLISIVLGIVSIYLLTALMYHEVKNEKRKERFANASTEKKYALISKYICILIGFMSVIRNLNSIVLLLMERKSILSDQGETIKLSLSSRQKIKEICNVLPKIGNAVLTFGIGLVYLFLWLRQRVFYIHPSLKLLNNNMTGFMSYAIVSVWVVYYIAIGFFYLTLVQYHLQPGGGCLVNNSSAYSYVIIIYTWGGISLLMQIGLLCLFIYPILKKMSWKVNAPSQNVVLYRRVKKAVILASICLVSDILSAVCPPLLLNENENDLFIYYSINLTINHVTTIMCFDHWKTLLWPWTGKVSCTARKQTKPETEKSTISESKRKNEEVITTDTTLQNYPG